MTLQIREWDGTPITEPGIYKNIPMSAYHGDPNLCAGPSISSSGLRTIYAQSPAHYWMHSVYNPCRVPEEQKEHFNLGRAAHTLLLGEEGFHQQYAVRPMEFRDWRTKAAQEWREEQKKAGLTVLTPENVEQIRGMAGLQPWQRDMPESGLANSAALSMGLLNGLVEQTLVWRDEETGVWLRARPDLIPHDGVGAIGADLKTIATQDPQKAIRDHAYHAQAALVADGMRACGAGELATFAFVFMSTTRPHTVTTIELAPYQSATGETVDPIEVGRRQNRIALRRFAACWRVGQWPAGDGDVREARLPDWYVRQIDDAEARDGALQEHPEAETREMEPAE